MCLTALPTVKLLTTGANSSSVTKVDFGANRIPIQDNVTYSDCSNANTQVIALSSMDTEPNWNKGFGKKLVIHSVSTLTNGTLTYDGNAITTATAFPHTIAPYDSTKLIFTRTDLSQNSKVVFEYAFEDAAGQSTLNVVNPPEPATVSYEFKALPDIADKELNVTSGVPFSYTPVHGTDGIVPVGTTYSWEYDGESILGVSGLESGTNQPNISGNIYNFCAYEHSLPFTITASTPDGCTSTFTVTLNVPADADNCGQIWYGLDRHGAGSLKDLGKVIDTGTDKGKLGEGVFHIPDPTISGTPAIAVYQTNPHQVFYIPATNTNTYDKIYVYDNSNGTNVEFRSVPKVSGVPIDNVKGMAFDKKGNLWLIDANKKMWMLPTTTEFGVTPTVWAADTEWQDHGIITNPEISTIGDMAFNWTGSMYLVTNNTDGYGHFYIINPLNLEGPGNVTADHIVQIYTTTGLEITGLASHLDLETFFISAIDRTNTNSYMYELDMKGSSPSNPPTVTPLAPHYGAIVGDLASCCLPQNLWVGTTSTVWNEPSNWIYEVVPRTGEDIEFANGLANNAKGIEAVKNLEVPAGISNKKEIGSLINETSLATIIPADASLTVHGKVIGSDTNPNKLQVKASETLPNGTLILAGQPCDDVVMGTVQMYAKGYQDTKTTWVDNIPGSPTNGTTFSASYHWQYFGIPVQSIVADPTFYGSFVRKYNEALNGGTYYQKWEPLNNTSVLTAFTGYEITQKAKKFIHMQGVLVFCNKTLTMTRKAPLVQGATGDNRYYGLGQNIFGNSFTAAIDINKIQFPAGDLVEETVYLYNTGRFTDWGGASTNSGTISAGAYTAIPVNAAPAVWDNQIPSMQGFLLKFTQDETTPNGSDAQVVLPYGSDGVVPNTKPQLVKRQGSGTADLKSAEQAPAEQEAPLSYLRVNLASQSTRDALWLFSQKGTTEGFDNGWDGRKFFGTPTAFIYTETPDGPMQVSANRTINGTYLTLYSNADTEYTLTLTKSNLDDYTDLVLHDLKTGTKTPLISELTEYKFTSHNTGNSEKRFLITGVKTYDDDNNTIDKTNKLSGYYAAQAQALMLTNNSGEEGTYSIYTAAGTLVKTEELTVGNHSYPISLNPGTYLVRLQAGTERGMVKMLVIN